MINLNVIMAERAFRHSSNCVIGIIDSQYLSSSIVFRPSLKQRSSGFRRVGR